MFYVYFLISQNNPTKSYLGYTPNLEERIKSHNSGQSDYTSKYKPWKLIFYSAFSKKEKAKYFEKYLKSGSGKTFIKRHFL
ncbi:MAG: GIY-YIG nuclease family protein [Candidatus Omnitrophota bacterium]